MGEVKKWSVTYTKHIKQKRKVYQDGVLELLPSRNKVILYDDCEEMLESRFVKNDDAFAPGESLAFESYLVDIGDVFPQGDDHKPISKFSQCQTNVKINSTSESFRTAKFERNPKLGQRKARSINISPSQKLIREYKKIEMTKYGSSPGCPETTKSSKEEWQVLYTTQITQKAKKYHDGFLHLQSCGSQRKQVLLYDETGRFLESRFLKVDEIIKSGESIAFDGHLVDIGELREDRKPPIDLKVEGRIGKMVGETERAGGQLHLHSQFPVGEYLKEVPSRHVNANFKSSIHENNISAPGPSKKPVRAAHEIMSILRKTKGEMDVATMESLSTDRLHAPQSSIFFEKKEYLQDAYDKGSKKVDLDEEKTRKTESSEISKYEDLEHVLLVEMTESEKTGSGAASSFFVGSGATDILRPVADTDSATSSTKYEDAPSLEPKSLTSPELDLKPKTAAVLQYRSREDLERGNHTGLSSCKESLDESAPEAGAGSDIHQFCVKVEPQDVSQPCAENKESDSRWLNGGQVIGAAILSDSTPHGDSDSQIISEPVIKMKKGDEFPSFDLGF